MGYTLILGNRTYSSWSLRAWLLLKTAGLPFEERLVPLYEPAFTRFREERFPARQVPTLIHDSGREVKVVWDSLAIAEFLSERHPEAGLWPREAAARAAARSLCAEMHAGFTALRAEMPMNLRRRYPGRGRGPDVEADIARACALWDWTRSRWGGEGPYLFGGDYGVVDAFFTPLAARFETYTVELEGFAKAYAAALLAYPALAEWRRAAESETWVFEHCEFDEPLTRHRPAGGAKAPPSGDPPRGG